MILSEVVAARNLLINLNVQTVTNNVYIGMENVFEKANQLRNVNKEILSERFESIKTSLSQFGANITAEIDRYNEIIARIEPDYYRESYRMYTEEMVYEPNDYILNRRLNISELGKETITKRVNGYVNSFHTGAQIRPGRDDLIEHMVGFNPLYLLDTSKELLDPAMNRFPEGYQNRLCVWPFKESFTEPLLARIPDNQYGMFLAYGYFEFKPLDLLKCFLVEIFAKLKPGGVFAFTFNDCDYEHSVEATEKRFMCYTPGRVVKEFAQSLGYQKLHEYHDQGVHWLELLKPGELRTIRGGQAYARIDRLPG